MGLYNETNTFTGEGKRVFALYLASDLYCIHVYAKYWYNYNTDGVEWPAALYELKDCATDFPPQAHHLSRW